MAQEDEVSILNSLLSTYSTFITYQPLRTEVSVLDYSTLPQTAHIYEMPRRALKDPFEEAGKAVAASGGVATAVLIPGRQFDAAGTRHGQGGGWYDRFLAHVPREWLRIGFCFDDQFSPIPLSRESWDQAMDYVFVVNRKTGATTLYSSEGGLES